MESNDALDTLASVSDDAAERLVLTRERALQAAMPASDVDGLDRLLHTELLAVGLMRNWPTRPWTSKRTARALSRSPS